MIDVLVLLKEEFGFYGLIFSPSILYHFSL
jgi:hypothetical protein